MVRKRPHPSLPGLDQQGGGAELSADDARMVPISADLRHRPPCVLASSSSVSERVFIMVDILMLMFFAIMGLVFLSYIIYMLWLCCQPRRRPLWTPDDAGSSFQHRWCSSWTMVGDALKPNMIHLILIYVVNFDSPACLFPGMTWSRLGNIAVLRCDLWSFLPVSDQLWPVWVGMWSWWSPSGASTLNNPGEAYGEVVGGGDHPKPSPRLLACTTSSPSIPPSPQGWSGNVCGWRTGLFKLSGFSMLLRFCMCLCYEEER